MTPATSFLKQHPFSPLGACYTMQHNTTQHLFLPLRCLSTFLSPIGPVLFQVCLPQSARTVRGASSPDRGSGGPVQGKGYYGTNEHCSTNTCPVFWCHHSLRLTPFINFPTLKRGTDPADIGLGHGIDEHSRCGNASS